MNPVRQISISGVCRLNNNFIIINSRPAMRKTNGKQECSLEDPVFYNASRFLLKLGEHTCGLSSVFDQYNWTNDRFYAALKAKDEDLLSGISSWVEQRMFTYTALDALGTHPLAAKVRNELQKLTARKPDLSGYKKLSDPTAMQTCGEGFKFKFSKDGSLISLKEPYTGNDWASLDNPLGQFVYQTYNQTDFDRFFKTYQANEYYWLGIGKPNMTNNSEAESRIWPTQVVEVYRIKGPGCGFQVHVQMKNQKAVSYYGAPRDVWISYATQNNSKQGLSVELQWFDKSPTRLPEALFFVFKPQKQESYSWELVKLGHVIDPLDVVLNGSERQHAIDKSAYYRSKTNKGLELVSPDAPIVTVLTQTDPVSTIPLPLQPIKQITGLAFQLFNNIWDVNFIFWYPYTNSDFIHGSKFRFSLNFLSGM